MSGQVVGLTLQLEECCRCGVAFGLTEGYQARARKTHESFYCPNGHKQHYPSKTREEERIAQLEKANAYYQEVVAEARENEQALTPELREARDRARGYARAQKGAFWRGYEDRECGREVGCCPYPTNAFGFRQAWMDGFGERGEVEV